MSISLRRTYRQLRKLLSLSDPVQGKEIIEVVFSDECILRFEIASEVERYRTAEFGGEREALERFLDVLQAGDIVYDIGASVGLFTVASAQCTGVEQVISFEPDPETNERLRKNVDLNRLSNVRVIDWAASSENDTVNLFTDGAAGFSPTLRKQERDGAPSGAIEIKTRTIDSAISEGILPEPDVLKIDIEGAEALCLEGCERLLGGEFGKQPRALFIEVHPEFLPDYNSSEEKVHSRIQNSGYQIEWDREREEQKHLLALQID